MMILRALRLCREHTLKFSTVFMAAGVMFFGSQAACHVFVNL